MKKILFILFLFLPLAIFAQQSEVFKIDSLPKQGVLLDKDWKFIIGDNPDFAKVDFNDASWKPINPTLDFFKLPQIPKTGQIVWFRLHLSIDSSLNRQLVMMVGQSGASEIYLNGKLIHHFGILSNRPGEIKAFNPLGKPVSFPLQQSLTQVLAVRYALQPHIFYTAIFGSPTNVLSIEINSLESGVENRKQNVINPEIYAVMMSIAIILFILYFAFYLFYSSQKANLYFSIYTFIISFIYAFQIFVLTHYYIESWYWYDNFLLIVIEIGDLFLLLAVYKLFVQKIRGVFWGIVALGTVSIPLAALVFPWGWMVMGLGFQFCIYADILRVAIYAVRKKKKGAMIIAAGCFVFLLSWVMFSFSNKTDAVFFINYAPYFFIIANLSMPVSVSIFLGYDFAQTHRALQNKLTEVENLSAEKQQILSAQNETLEKQVTERTTQLNQSLTDLKSTQAQLIQSEKIASLGELTAGIAHEIQNPLNFVNNFSEVNKEMITEMKDEIDKGNYYEAKLIANDIEVNSEKINHHGKRAGDIVKGMLQHSRTSTGVKELTDINALADEYLRLSYHGLRAKDKSFNAKMETNFDESIGKINIIPQDIGRVLLNLYNNAFYAVSERLQQAQPDIHYEPTVSVTTKKSDNHVLITVSDNGNGIPQKIVDKIFQPFFTTKPTGQGTGLGLSLSYDIIKAHGGEIKVETLSAEAAAQAGEENVGTEFIIQIPLKLI